MNQTQTKSRTPFLMAMFAIILVVISVLVLIKPIMWMIYPLKYESYIETYSDMYMLDKYMVMGIISAESKFDENAVSHKDAKGLMQLKDETAQWCVEKFDIENHSDPNEMNINVGCAYMRYLIDKYSGNVETALAAYNAGEGNVSKWLSEQEGDETDKLQTIPFAETANYVDTVSKRTKIYGFLY